MSSQTEKDLQFQDPELIKRLAETGAIVVVLDFPVGSEFGEK